MRRLAWRTVLPALLAIVLFSGVVFFYLLPSLGRVVMDQKRLMISELTESSWNILARFEFEEREGRMTREEAQAAAIAQVRNLHYGRESKDYFWIIDMHPRMVVHPYRPDLEGTDLSTLADPRGALLFVDMVSIVEREGAGYVQYMWQWKDDSARIVPKLSFVKGFEPWDWIIGTGVYTEDVDVEIGALKENLQAASLIILGIVALLLSVLLRAGFQAEQGRSRAAEALVGSEQKYRSLVESAGEAIVMAIEGEGLYANASLLHLLGYESHEFASQDIASIIMPTVDEQERGLRHWQAVTDGVEAPNRYEAELAHKDGSLLRVMLTLSRIVVEHRVGFMALAVKLSRPRELDIHAAVDLDDVEAASRRTRDLATLMMNHGAHAGHVSHMLSVEADAVVCKAVEFIIKEMGPPPTTFDILLMGSLGRGDVTLTADQDHAIIYKDVPDDVKLVVREYFLTMGRRLSDLLDAAGFPYCQGKIMSGESDCCRSLSGWCEGFDGWITTLEPQDLLRAKIFFDFRSTLNEPLLVPALRDHLKKSLEQHPRFFPMFANSILHYEPPLNVFGGIVAQQKKGPRSGFDIKGVLAQVVDIARLKALQYGVSEVGTLKRLEVLAANGSLRKDTSLSLAAAYETLFEIRLRHQARKRADQLEVDNLIDPSELEPADIQDLKDAFRQIKAVQSALQHEFGVRP